MKHSGPLIRDTHCCLSVRTSMKIFFKLFLATAIPFGLFYGVWMSFFVWSKKAYPWFAGVVGGVLAGIFFGLFMTTAFLAIARHQSKRRFGKGNLPALRQERQLVVDLSYAQAFGKAKEALGRVKAKIRKMDESAGIIEAKTPFGWHGAGELVTIQVVKRKEDKSQMRIESRPFLKTTIFDGGRNFDLVEKVKSILTTKT